MKNVKGTIYACYIGYITQAIVNNLAPLLFVTFQNEFRFSLKQIGFLVSLNFIVQIIVDLFTPKIAQKAGYRACILSAHIFSCIGLIGMGIFPFAFSNSYIGILTAVVISAIGGGIIEVLVSPIAQALPGDSKDRVMSMLHSFYCWGHVMVVILSTVYFKCIGISYWRYLAMLWAIVPFLNIVLFARVPVFSLEETQNTGEESKSYTFKQLCSDKLFYLFLLLMICAGSSEQAMSQWTSYFAEAGLNVSKTLGDLMGSCAFAIMMGISRAVYGFYGKRMNLMRFMIGSTILCIACYLVAVIASNPWISLAGCAICGFSVGILWPGCFSLAATYIPRGGTLMFALFAFAGDIGCSVGPGAVGAISNQVTTAQTGIKLGLSVMICCPVLMAIGLFLLFRYRIHKNEKQTIYHA